MRVGTYEASNKFQNCSEGYSNFINSDKKVTAKLFSKSIHNRIVNIFLVDKTLVFRC